MTRLSIHDYDQAWQIYVRCRAKLLAEGIEQWTEEYPNEKVLKKDIDNEDLYGIQKDGKWVGLICINEYQDEEYKMVDWKDKMGKVLVVHRLAVDPVYQREGLAGKLMDFAEKYAQEQAYDSIRLDAYSKNPHTIRFYKKRNYQVRGSVNFAYRVDPFICFEKAIFTD